MTRWRRSSRQRSPGSRPPLRSLHAIEVRLIGEELASEGAISTAALIDAIVARGFEWGVSDGKLRVPSRMQHMARKGPLDPLSYSCDSEDAPRWSAKSASSCERMGRVPSRSGHGGSGTDERKRESTPVSTACGLATSVIAARSEKEFTSFECPEDPDFGSTSRRSERGGSCCFVREPSVRRTPISDERMRT